MQDEIIPDDFYVRDTIRCTPPAPDPLRHVRDSLRPPKTPSGVGPYSPRPEVLLVVFGVAGAASAVFLGTQLARYWSLGGWIGLARVGSIILAAGLVSASIALAVVFRRIRE